MIIMSKTTLLKEIEYENQILSEGEYYGRTVAVIDRTTNPNLDLKPLLADKLSRVKERFGENSKFVDIYKQIKATGADFVYLLGISYQNQKDKFNKLIDAYELLGQIEVDVVALNNVELGEVCYFYPDVETKVQVPIILKATKDDRDIGTKYITSYIFTNKDEQYLTDKPIKDFFDSSTIIYNKNIKASSTNSFRHIRDLDKSSGTEVKNNKLTVTNELTKINETLEYKQKASYYTESFDAIEVADKGAKFKSFSVEIEGDFDYADDFKGVEVYYQYGEESNDNYKRYTLEDFANQNKVYFKNKEKTGRFRVELNNFRGNDDPPSINKLKFNLTLSGEDKAINYHVYSPSSYAQVYARKPKSLIKGYIRKDKFIEDNRKKVSFVKELAKFCRLNKHIGLVKASKETEDLDSWYSDLVSKIEDEKENLKLKDNDLGRYIGCVVSEIEYSTNQKPYTGNAILALAGLFNLYGSGSSPTNKEIKNAKFLNDKLSKTEVNNLTDVGYIVCKDTSRNGIAPYHVQSLEENNSTYYSLNTTRKVNELTKRIQDLTDDYIGDTSPNINKLKKELDKTVNLMKNEENKFTNIKYELNNVTSKYIKIDLEAKPVGEIFNTSLEIENSI